LPGEQGSRSTSPTALCSRRRNSSGVAHVVEAEETPAAAKNPLGSPLRRSVSRAPSVSAMRSTAVRCPSLPRSTAARVFALTPDLAAVSRRLMPRRRRSAARRAPICAPRAEANGHQPDSPGHRRGGDRGRHDRSRAPPATGCARCIRPSPPARPGGGAPDVGRREGSAPGASGAHRRSDSASFPAENRSDPEAVPAPGQVGAPRGASDAEALGLSKHALAKYSHISLSPRSWFADSPPP